MRITRGMKMMTPPSNKSKSKRKAPDTNANANTNSDYSGNSMDALAEAAYLEGECSAWHCFFLSRCWSLPLCFFVTSADEKKKNAKRSRQTVVMSADEKKKRTVWEILESDIVTTGSKTQIKTKKIALTEFLNAMLMNTTPREDVYDGLLCIMERLPRS